MHEECVIRPRADDADLDAILRVPAREGVDAIKALLRVEVIERALAVDPESVVIARDIHRSPPDVVLRIGMLDHTLVFRRASGLDTGVGDECAVLRNARVFLETNCVLVERARGEVVVDGGDSEAMGGKIEGGGCRAHRWGRFWVRRINQPAATRADQNLMGRSNGANTMTLDQMSGPTHTSISVTQIVAPRREMTAY